MQGGEAGGHIHTRLCGDGHQLCPQSTSKNTTAAVPEPVTVTPTHR